MKSSHLEDDKIQITMALITDSNDGGEDNNEDNEDNNGEGSGIVGIYNIDGGEAISCLMYNDEFYLNYWGQFDSSISKLSYF